ncbi:MAG TPA: GNAT family protein [Actinomycetota bacterium]|nr:GNAT family protein [Actinomycetota bacterium]
MTLTLRGRTVTLRPFRAGEVERLVQVWSTASPGGSAGHRGVPERERIEQRVARSGAWSDEDGEGLWLAIEAAGRLVGEIQARSPRGGLPPGVFELGVELHEPSDRGRGLGSEAVAELAGYLFREEQAHRVQMSTDVDNAAMRAVAERLGFTLEGVLRGFMPGTRGARDHAMYGMTRNDWENEKDRWIRTG